MSDRPLLPAIAWEHLELAAKRVDAKYWEILKSYQIAYDGPKTLSPPKTPQLILNALQMYAGELFRLEEPNYSKNSSSYGLWIVALGERIMARVLSAFAEVEESEGDAKLAYHGLSMAAAREGLEVMAAVLAFEYAGIPIPTEPAKKAPPPATLAEPIIEANPEIVRRAALLAQYKAANHDVSSKRIYEAQNSGIHKPEFYRWIKGDLPATSTPARKFERFLTAKKMPVPRKRKS